MKDCNKLQNHCKKVQKSEAYCNTVQIQLIDYQQDNLENCTFACFSKIPALAESKCSIRRGWPCTCLNNLRTLPNQQTQATTWSEVRLNQKNSPGDNIYQNISKYILTFAKKTSQKNPCSSLTRHTKNVFLKLQRTLIIALIAILPSSVLAQVENNAVANKQIDLIDLASHLLDKQKQKRVDTDSASGKMRISAVPAAGYTLQTGFAGLLVANSVFKTSPDANISTIVTSFTYTVRNQVILPLQANIFTKNNNYNLVTDWRYLYFPSYTYGLGGYTSLNDGYLIDYSAIRLHQTLMRKVKSDIYVGIGYNLDYFWDIKELNPPPTATDFQQYGLKKTEFASGITFNFLYDTRKNSVNPQGGSFVNAIYRPNLTVFGNSATWRSFVLDARKYIRFPANTDNILALWTYEWLTVSGKPPYLMLPNTGGDPYSNTGRGYIQGRFRGANMAYIEGEYRFPVSRNELIGGVIFANAESFTEQSSNKFETIAPGWGAGVRIKLNKFSNTNIAIDYGFGLGGSGGVFVNLGEVF